MKKFFINTLSAAALLATIYGCGKDSFDKPDYYSRKAETVFGQQVVDGSADYIAHVKTSTEKNLMDGVQLSRIPSSRSCTPSIKFFSVEVFTCAM